MRSRAGETRGKRFELRAFSSHFVVKAAQIAWRAHDIACETWQGVSSARREVTFHAIAGLHARFPSLSYVARGRFVAGDNALPVGNEVPLRACLFVWA